MVEACCKCEIGMFMDYGVTALVCGRNNLRITKHMCLLRECDFMWLKIHESPALFPWLLVQMLHSPISGDLGPNCISC